MSLREFDRGEEHYYQIPDEHWKCPKCKSGYQEGRGLYVLEGHILNPYTIHADAWVECAVCDYVESAAGFYRSAAELAGEPEPNWEGHPKKTWTEVLQPFGVSERELHAALQEAGRKLDAVTGDSRETLMINYETAFRNLGCFPKGTCDKPKE